MLLTSDADHPDHVHRRGPARRHATPTRSWPWTARATRARPPPPPCGSTSRRPSPTSSAPLAGADRLGRRGRPRHRLQPRRLQGVPAAASAPGAAPRPGRCSSARRVTGSGGVPGLLDRRRRRPPRARAGSRGPRRQRRARAGHRHRGQRVAGRAGADGGHRRAASRHAARHLDAQPRPDVDGYLVYRNGRSPTRPAW